MCRTFGITYRMMNNEADAGNNMRRRISPPLQSVKKPIVEIRAA